MKHFICLYFILICAIPTLIRAQSSENFDEITVDANGNSLSTTNSRIIGNWSLSILDNAGKVADPSSNYLDVTNLVLNNGGTNMANGSNDNALNVYGEYNVAKTFVMKSANSTAEPFALSSFTIDGGTTTWLAEGYLRGTRVVTQAIKTTNLTPLKVNLNDPQWEYIDEFRIEQQNGAADIYFFLDDIKTTTATALPITFTLFKGEVLPQGVQLKWDLGVKTGVQSFTIQRSLDQKNFKDVGSVDITANKDQQDYTYLDPSAQAGLNYYRIKIEKSTSGSAIYSKIIQVNIANSNPNPITNPDSNSATIWRLYPNPIQNQLNIAAPKTVQSPVTLDIITASGQMLKSIILPGQTEKWQLNVSYLAHGIYFLRLHQNGQVIAKLKMIKQ